LIEGVLIVLILRKKRKNEKRKNEQQLNENYSITQQEKKEILMIENK
jgi:hypothetical protein